VYVSNARDTTVSVIDIASLTVIATVRDVGSQPFDEAFGP
jgi:YVTN family beta-propeller protein